MRLILPASGGCGGWRRAIIISLVTLRRLGCQSTIGRHNSQRSFPEVELQETLLYEASGTYNPMLSRLRLEHSANGSRQTMQKFECDL